MDAGPRIDSYTWSGGREPMLRFGPEDGPVVILALPLFEEANRTRAFGVSILRALASRAIGGVLPELPGQGESEVPTGRLRLGDLRSAFAAVPGTHAVTIRSGAVVLDERPGWLLAPQTRPELLRELTRMKGKALDGSSEVAGNILSTALLADLASDHLREGGDERMVVRLSSDPGTADRRIDGPPLWRRAEPDNDPLLVQILASDIADWLGTCAA